jgi:2-phosphosulfolactate phosphatase
MSNLEIRRVNRLEATEARGVVIVIDVIRAFTVAVYALAGGAHRLWLVRTVDEAFALREREPQALLAGEVGGRLIPGFDFNNSPSLMAAADVDGRLLIQRTGAGTQGAVNAVNASHILLCSLVNTQATALLALKLADTTGGIVTLLPTENIDLTDELGEDNICADYVEALLRGHTNASTILSKNIARLEEAGRFDFLKFGDPDFPFEDKAAIIDIDRFDFVMVGTHKQWKGIIFVEVEKRTPFSIATARKG